MSSLDDAIATAVTAVLREQLPELLAGIAAPEPSPALLDRAGLARALSCSVGSVDKMRRMGMPAVRLLDSVRFDIDDVVKWMKSAQESEKRRGA